MINRDVTASTGIKYLDMVRELAGDKAKLCPNVVPPGRPYFVAHMPTPLEFDELKLKYYDIMAELTHKEAMAWCRGFGYKWSTFLMRRYQHRRPKMEEVILTIGWYDDGKPVQRRNRYTFAVFEQLLNQHTAGCSVPGSSTNPGAGYHT